LENHIDGTNVMEDMNNVRMTPLKKTPNAKQPKKYRWICVCHIMQKVMDLVFVKRLVRYIHQRIDLNQCGFIPGREGLDVTMTVNRIVSVRKEQNKPTFLFSMDAIGAFPRLSREVMKESLKAFGFGPQAMRWINTMYADTRVTAEVNEDEVETKSVAGGIQGAVATPLLYIITKFMCDRAFKAKFPKYTRSKMYAPKGPEFQSPRSESARTMADEIHAISLVFADDELGWTGSREELEAYITDIVEHSRKFSIQIHKDKGQTKSVIILIIGKHQIRGTFNEDDIEIPDGGIFKFKTSVTHIGHILDEDWSFVRNRDSRIGRTRTEWNRCRDALLDSRLTERTRMEYYETFVLPNMVQNSEPWPKGLLKKVVELHNSYLQQMCEVEHAEEMEECDWREEEILCQMQDRSMELHLLRRLLQWVGRAVAKGNLGLFALKGVLDYDEETNYEYKHNKRHIKVKPTATDIRISEGLMELAARVEADISRNYWWVPVKYEDQDGQEQTRYERFTPEQMAKIIRTGIKEEKKATREQPAKIYCEACERYDHDRAWYGIAHPNTKNAFSELHKHYETCKGYTEFEKAINRKVSIEDRIQAKKRTIPEFCAMKEPRNHRRARENMLKEAERQRQYAVEHENKWVWTDLAEIPSLWKRLLQLLI